MSRQVSSSKMTLLILAVFCVGIHSAVFQETDEIQDGGLAVRADDTVDDAGDSETVASDEVSALKFGRGWRCFPGKSCYFIYPDQKFTWSTARTQCISRGARLATIDDAFEDAYLREYARLEGNMWIGFNDMSTEGYWRWDSGTTVNYLNWRSGYPRTSPSTNTYDCAYMHRSYNGQWFDATCTSSYGYICEKRY
ncbi:C-type lectin mannose-binding isoform-like [Ptychodera flava]|uniref:C-type lectin mannose-binding isoform-like n=1 Tax=Ptychodera flava TaxID=63121 RepID=UPI00396AADC9